MNLVHKIENWGDMHHPATLDAVRVVLGIFLFLKGMAFMDNTADLRSIIEAQDTSFSRHRQLSRWFIMLRLPIW